MLPDPRSPLPGLGAEARHVAARLEAVADRWIDGPPPTVAELGALAADLGELLGRIAVARTVLVAAAAGKPDGSRIALSA